MTVSEFFNYVRREDDLLRAMRAEQELNRANIAQCREGYGELSKGQRKEMAGLLMLIEQKASIRERDIVAQINYHLDLQKKADSIINRLDRVEDKAIMKERYILGRSWSEIAENAHWSEPQVYRMHSRAMKELAEKVREIIV